MERIKKSKRNLKKKVEKMTVKIVTAKNVESWSNSITVLFGYTPKMHIQCGKCMLWFHKRFPLRECEGKNPHAPCKECGTINRLPIMITYNSGK